MAMVQKGLPHRKIHAYHLCRDIHMHSEIHTLVRKTEMGLVCSQLSQTQSILNYMTYRFTSTGKTIKQAKQSKTKH
jgi:hypothetical protein